MRAFCSEMPDGYCQLEIVDVSDNPDVAEADSIMATPTLIRMSPLPALRLVGDVSDQPSLARLTETFESMRYMM